MTLTPSSTPSTKSIATNPISDCQRCIQERHRADAILTDLQNAQADVIAKNRTIGKLKADLTKHREEAPENVQVRELLTYARQTLVKTSRWYIGLDGDRAKLASKALSRYGMERCKKAVDGLASKPFAGPRGRSAESYSGAKRWDDLDYCFGTDKRFSDCETYAEELEKPQLEVVKPNKPGPARRRLDRIDRGDAAPIDTVLQGLADHGFQWRGSSASDQWRAQCPAHEGDGFSLSISRNPEGMVLTHCHSQGCSHDQIMAALGLEVAASWRNCETDQQALNHRDSGDLPMPPHLVVSMMQLVKNRDVPADLRREMVGILEREGRDEREAA